MRSRIAILVLSVFMLASVGVFGAAAAPAAPAVATPSPSQVATEVAQTTEGMQVMADVVAQQVPQLAGPVRAACAAATGGTSPDVEKALSVLTAELTKLGAGANASGVGSCILKGISAYKTCMKWIHNSKYCGYFGGGVIGICLYDLWH